MRKRLKNKFYLRTVITVTLLLCLLVPVGVALAESFGRTSTVLEDAGDVIGDTYQRHTFIAEGLHWVFYATDDAIFYTSSADATNWDLPTKFDDYLCDMPPEECCNGSVFALWYNLPLNYVDIAWMNVSGENEPILYRMGHPVSNGSITWYPVFEAVPAVADLTYSHPSICDNTDDYPFIAYMVYNSSDTSYSASLSADTDNSGHWIAATNSTINSATSFNLSVDVLYPSVVPVTGGNVSVMVVFGEAPTFLLAQNYADYDVGTDTWTYPLPAQLPLPADTTIAMADLPYHSEIAWSGNLTNPDDVWAIATANSSILGKYLWNDHYGDPLSPWSDDVAIGTGWYRGSLGIRNALGWLRATTIEIVQKRDLYESDFDMTSQTWSTLSVIGGVDATSGTHTESDYDNAGTDNLGVIYYDHMVAFVPDLEYGCYGCSVPPAPVPESVTTIAWIIVIVFGALICIILIGYGAYESSRGRTSELAKVGAAGLIGLIIAAIIIEELL